MTISRRLSVFEDLGMKGGLKGQKFGRSFEKYEKSFIEIHNICLDEESYRGRKGPRGIRSPVIANPSKCLPLIQGDSQKGRAGGGGGLEETGWN